MIKNFGYASLVFFLGALGFACRTTTKSSNGVVLKLDSVFINAYEHGRFDDAPYIFFYYALANDTDDSLQVTIKRRSTGSDVTDKSLCIYKNDTLELFGGNFTPSQFIVTPHEKKNIDLNLDPIDLLDLLEKYKTQNNSEQDILKDIATNGTNYFVWDGKILTDLGLKRKIVFRNPSDSSAVEWK